MDRSIDRVCGSVEVFAGLTSVIAKQGLSGVSSELGLTVRTLFVCAFVAAFGALSVPASDWSKLSQRNVAWLALSGAATAVSWVFDYKALKLGDVSTVALIDKGSFLVAVFLAWLFLGEHVTPRVLAGCGLVLSGLLVVA